MADKLRFVKDDHIQQFCQILILLIYQHQWSVLQFLGSGQWYLHVIAVTLSNKVMREVLVSSPDTQQRTGGLGNGAAVLFLQGHAKNLQLYAKRKCTM